jgi:dTDP-glucose pyrophosphorylase
LKKFDLIITQKTAKIKQAMNQLDQTAEKILFVVDERNRLVGSLTDGDIRRWILADGTLEATVEEVCFKDTFFVYFNYNIDTVKKEVIERRISHVPVVDNEKKIIEFLIWDDIFKGTIKRKISKKLNLPVIIMAGGKGSRLEPFTKILPKPLIPIGESSIIEIIINKFLEFGVNRYFISIHHKAKIIKSYFEELQPKYEVTFIYEEEPLGTIGSLRLMKDQLHETFILTNCDILVDADYSDFIKYHMDNSFDVTLIASMKNYRIPYGICKVKKGGLLLELQEKPEFDFLINTGMYIINSNVIDYIPENTYFDITQLIERLQGEKMKIGVYPISEFSWTDTGEWEEYKKAVNKLRHDK